MDRPELIKTDALYKILEDNKTLFITVPPEILKVADSDLFFTDLIKKTEATHIFYSGSALPVEDIQNLFNSLKTKDFSRIVAIGGGTIMDISKIIAIALSNNLENIAQILDYPTGYKNSRKLICIPTTCGTGSEATHFAVVYKDKKKYSIAERSITPDYVVLHHKLLLNLPEKIRNSTVLDAMAQAVESMWAKNSNEKSLNFAENALTEIISGLKTDDIEEKLKFFQKGSFLAGKAINISKTTASHAISYPLSAHFGIPHGIAVFLTLPSIARYNFNNSESNCFPKLFNIFGVSEINTLANKMKKVMSDMGFSLKLNDYGIKKSDIDLIAGESIVPGRSDNNPADLSPGIVKDLLLEII